LATNLEGKSCLLSGGAPDSPVHHRTTTVASGARSPFIYGAPNTVRCTPDIPVCPTDRWHGPRVARWSRGRLLAAGAVGSSDSPVNFSHIAFFISQERRVRRGWLTGQSGEPPDSPVNYSCTTPSIPESSRFTVDQPGAPDTVRCTTGQSGLPCPS
jgi:hypothetical protein